MINSYESPLYITGAIYENQWIDSPTTQDYIPTQQSCWGYIDFIAFGHLSAYPSHVPCPLCNTYSSGSILSILATNDL